MLTETEVAGAVRDANPVPEPDALHAERASVAALFSLIEERRNAMVQTPSLTESPHGGRRRRLPRPVAVVAALAALLLAVPAIAYLLDDAPPPLQETYPPIPVGKSEVVFGPEDGLGEGCAHRVAFDDDVAWMAGRCGLLRREGDSWIVVAPLSAETTAVTDLAISVDGSVWIAGPDGPLSQFADGSMVEHPVTAYRVAPTPDGMVWVEGYATGSSDSHLWRFDGRSWTDLDEQGGESSVALASDGTLWVTTTPPYWTEAEPVLFRSYRDGAWTTHDVPAGIAPSGELSTADGTLWMQGSLSGATDEGAEASLVTYDGSTWSTSSIRVPGSEIEHLVFAADGTLWLNGYFGPMAYVDGAWSRQIDAPTSPDGRVNFIAPAPDGSVWIGTDVDVTAIRLDH